MQELAHAEKPPRGAYVGDLVYDMTVGKEQRESQKKTTQNIILGLKSHVQGATYARMPCLKYGSLKDFAIWTLGFVLLVGFIAVSLLVSPH